MTEGRQKSQQLELVFTEEPRGEAPATPGSRVDEVKASSEPESPAETEVTAQPAEPPCADPHAWWCGRGGAVRPPPIPMRGRQVQGA